MKKAKIFIGPAASGKTFMARQIAAQFGKEESVFMLSRHSNWNKPFAFDQCSEWTKLLVIDKIVKPSEIETLFNVVTEGVNVKRRGSKTAFTIHPQIILICQEGIELPTGASFDKRFDVVSFPVNEPVYLS